MTENNGPILNLPEENIVQIVCDDLTVTFEKGTNDCFVDIRNNANIADSNENLSKKTLDDLKLDELVENGNHEDIDLCDDENFLEIIPKQERKSSRVSFSQLRLHFEAEEVDNEVGNKKKDYLERRIKAKQTLFIIHNEVQSASCVQVGKFFKF